MPGMYLCIRFKVSNSEYPKTSSRVFQLLDRLPVGERISGERPKSLKGEITFEDVYFSYPARPDTDVLNGMSLNLHPGKVVAFVRAISYHCVIIYLTYSTIGGTIWCWVRSKAY